ncbi:MAG: cation transporter [Lentisphaerales bacterium]|nr:cation transporter [Lentisphaerales bacterium]
MKFLSFLLVAFLVVGCSESAKESTTTAKPADSHAGHDHAPGEHGHDHSHDKIAAKPMSTENAVVLRVEKMDCGGCAKKIKKALYQFPGIKTLTTTPTTRTVVIEIGDKEKFNLDTALAKIKNDAGYDAVVQ